MLLLKKIPILLLVLTFSCGTINLPRRRPANEVEAARFSLPRMTESSFNQRLDRELQKHVDIIATKLSEPEAKALDKVKKKVLQIVHDNNPWQHVKHILIQHGKGAAVTAAVTEIITVGVLPAVLTAAGLTGAALFSASSPSFAITVPAYIVWKNARQKKKLARELGFNSLKELDQLRKQILGFCTQTRLLSKVYRGAEGAVEINIVKRRFAKWRKSPMGNIIDLYKIEEIANENLDKRVLEILKPLSKEDPSVYATVLVDQIQKHPVASDKLSAFVKGNMAGMPYKLSDHQQTMLLLVHEKQAYITDLKMKVRKYKASATKEIRRLGLSPDSKKIISEYTENVIVDLETVEMDIKRFEYTFLNHLNLGESVSEEQVNESTKNLLRRVKEAESNLAGFENQLKNVNQVDKIGMKQLVFDLKANNGLWKPFATATENDGNCTSIASKILTQSKIMIQ